MFAGPSFLGHGVIEYVKPDYEPGRRYRVLRKMLHVRRRAERAKRLSAMPIVQNRVLCAIGEAVRRL